jgi:hypothetical protein
MKFTFLKSRKFWWRFIAYVIVLPVILEVGILGVIFMKQDAIIQSQINSMNEGHVGMIKVGNSHLAPFNDFPNMSVKIDDVRVYETKVDTALAILDVADIYISFNLIDIYKGKYDIQSVLVERGYFNIVFHKDGTNNLEHALTTEENSEQGEPLDIHLKSIKLKNLDIHKFDERTNLDVETYVYQANGVFKTENDLLSSHIDSEFEMNIVDNGEPTYIRHKHFEFHTDLTFNKKSGMLKFNPSRITMEHGDFELEGSLDTKNEMTIDITVKGTKPNFDMLIAFAPHDVIPILERYKNAGKIYFNAVIQGPTVPGKTPFIDAQFGASEAFLENIGKGKRIDNMGFKGHFTNGGKRNLETMKFSLTGMTATLDKGNFLGAITVKNFEEPDIDMQLDADFDLQFLTDFLNLNEAETNSGSVSMHMKFHDIIDLDNPEHTLKNLNQAYYAELKIDNLAFDSKDLPAAVEQLDVHVIMKGKKAQLDKFKLKIGESDLSITGYLSDLPAILHHTNIPVVAHLEIKSDLIDVAQLTKYSEKDSIGVDEQIENLSLGLSFNSSAKAFTESEYLPTGEFFIDSLHAQLKHYPHELHDFHVDVLVDDRDLRIKDFTGFIDKSDFHFNGLVHEYEFWMQKELNGDVDLDITLKSDALHLEDIFSYKGINYVPEDYQHEEFDRLELHVNSSMHYKNSSLHSIDIDLDKFNSKLHVHPMRFEDFRGRFHYEDDHLVIQHFHGKMGRTIFDIDLNYYLGDDPAIRIRDNHLSLKSNYIDFDQLHQFNTESPAKRKKTSAQAIHDAHANATKKDVAEHAEAFNLYELPFTDMQFDIDVRHFIYHRIDLKKVKAQCRITHNHYLYIDTLNMDAAGGSIQLSGYFNGSDPKHIYFKPVLKLKEVEIDKLMFKFENFGQDMLVSENIHGKLTADIKGTLRMYPDLVPDLDQSEVHMDIQVLDGKLENYEYMLMLSEYMGDKDLSTVRFDTLQNHMDITEGVLTIPNMTIESTIGHFEMSGTQDMSSNMEYYIRIPWKVIRSGARHKLFGKKKTKDGEVGDDEIIEVDPNKKTRYLNLKITGNIDGSKIRPGKAIKRKG